MASLRIGSHLARLPKSKALFSPASWRMYADQPGAKSQAAPSSAPPTPKASGPKAQESGQTDNTKYQAQEYYEYNEWSFYDIDCDMAKYRLPQPKTADPLK